MSDNTNLTDLTDETGKADRTFGSVNRTLYAAPGELHDTLDTATAGDEVRLHAGEEYDPGSEVAVPPHVTLDFNGAIIAPTSDYDVLFADHGVTVRNINIHLEYTSSYTSALVTLDTDRAGGKYGLGYTGDRLDTAVKLHGQLDGINSATKGANATGLLLTGSDDGIALGNVFDLDLRQLDIGLHADVEEVDTSVGFVQGPQFFLRGAGCRVFIEQSPMCNFRSIIYGHFQCTGNTEIVIRNNGQKRGPDYYGSIWDTHTLDNPTALVGENITVHWSAANSLIGNVSADPGQMAVSTEGHELEVIDYETGTIREINAAGSKVRAYLSADQAYATADGAVDVLLDSTTFDTVGEFDATTNSITVTRSGEYKIDAQTNINQAAAGDGLVCRVAVNGSLELVGYEQLGDSGTQTVRTSGIVSLNSGDTVKLQFKNFNNDCTILGAAHHTYLSLNDVA